MTSLAVPSGPAGPAPSGPAGPRPSGPHGPQPSGPPPGGGKATAGGTGAPWPTRPQGPSGPGGPTGPGRAADDHLFAAVDELIADLQTPARPRLDSAAAVVGGPAQATRMVPGECLAPGYDTASGRAVIQSGSGIAAADAGASSRAGRPPALGTGTIPLPPAPFAERTPAFEIGVGPQYDALPRWQP